MRTLVVYDSLFGNTEKIARAIGSALPGEVEVLRVSEAGPALLRPLDLLVVGCPTQNSAATKAILGFVEGIPSQVLKAASVASFDTRYQSRFATLLGSGASKIADGIKKRGGTLVAPPEGFVVKGKQGPLKDGEIERAAAWAKGLVAVASRVATG